MEINKEIEYPKYCCQECGELIGWVPMFIMKHSFGMWKHTCKTKKNKRKII